MMHVPRWKKLMFAASLAVLPACGMEGPDSPEAKGLDPLAHTEPGQTRAALTTGPASCQDIKTAHPSAADGLYVLFLSGHRSRPWTAWCHNMASTPAEYLSLPSTGSSANFSQYTAGYNNGGGTNVRTLFTRVRIDPSTLRVNTGDLTFSTSSGLLWHGVAVTSMAYAAAMNCDFGNPGLGNVDLRGTPFAAAPNQFVPIGYYGSGGATYSSDNQVVDLWNRGECGYMAVQGSPDPFNGRGAQLQLQYRTGFLTNLAGPWSPTAGSTWTEPLSGGKQGAAGGDGFLLSAQTGGDFTYEGDVRVVSGVAAALTFRANADATQHYTANVDTTGVVKLWRPGRDIAVYPTPLVAGRTYHLKVVANGSRFLVYLDNGTVPVIDATDTAYANGRFGLNVYAGTGLIQNITVSP